MRVKSNDAVYSLSKEGMKEISSSSDMPFYAKRKDVRKGLRGDDGEIPYFIPNNQSKEALKEALASDGMLAQVDKNEDGSVEIGCQFFTKDQAKKLKAWANSK